MFKLIPIQYRILGGVIILAALLGSSFWYGYNKAENKYLTKIATYQAEAELLETKLNAALAEVKVQVVTKFIDRVKTIKEKEYVYKDRIVTVPSKCELSNGWVSSHDASASSSELGAAEAADAASSGIKDTEALRTVIENYSICHQNAEQVLALQDYILKREKEINKYNKEIRER